MSGHIAALPMYDWPERRDEVDAEWRTVRDHLRAAGIDAPEGLTRETGDLLEFWRRPDLLFAQTCWGPMELGLADHVQVVGQQNYDGIEGGEGELYSSAIVMRALPSPLWGGSTHSVGVGGVEDEELPPPGPSGHPPNKGEGKSSIPIDLLRGKRLAYNVPDSMSGIMGLARDLEALGESLDIFAGRSETGGHRASIRAVAAGTADIAAIDCMTWHLARLHEPAAKDLEVVGWTSKRLGLPFITAKSTPPGVAAALREAVRT